MDQGKRHGKASLLSHPDRLLLLAAYAPRKLLRFGIAKFTIPFRWVLKVRVIIVSACPTLGELELVRISS